MNIIIHIHLDGWRIVVVKPNKYDLIISYTQLPSNRQVKDCDYNIILVSPIKSLKKLTDLLNLQIYFHIASRSLSKLLFTSIIIYLNTKRC